MKILLFSVLALSSLVPAVGHAATYYVAPGGSDKNDGLSAEKPFKTAQRAADKAEPGDKVLFAGGVYQLANGEQFLKITRSGAPGKPIMFAAMPDQKPHIKSRFAWQCIEILGARHIEIRGLKLQGAASEIKLDEALREKENLKNPRTSGNGIGITDDKTAKANPAHVLIRDCEVSDFPGGGIYTMHADYLTIENNIVARCGFWSPYANSGISVYQPMDVDNNTDTKIVIRNNVSFENHNYVPFFYSHSDPAKRKVTDGNGIIIDDYDNSQEFGGGNNKPYSGRTVVANNVTFGNGGSGIHSYRGRNALIAHNYAADNNRHPDIKGGQIFANTSKNVLIANNVLLAPPEKAVNSNDKNEGVDYAYNFYGTTSGTIPAYVGELGSNKVGMAKLVLTDWNTGRRDLWAAPDSPLRRAGTSIADAGNDFFDKKRNSPCDIGPFNLAPPPVISPEVLPDRRVIFRLRAPGAKEVKVNGEWGQGAALTRDDEGLWSATLGPLSPDLYGYNFNVDGLTILDPANTVAKPMRSNTTSVLEIPGAKPAPVDRVAAVARGAVHLHDYDSKALGRARRLRVYTPPGYEKGGRFPVLYLLHGSGDNEATWTELGRANVILDNLIAAKKAVPMIVVMTDGHAYTGNTPDARYRNTPDYERDLLQDVMPLVETSYRVKTGRDTRAIAGLSMGGNQALTVGLNHLNLFAWVGGFSSAIRDPETQLAPFWKTPKPKARLLWIAIGKDDFLLKENRYFDRLLTERKIAHEYLETTGNHSWPVWRRYLADFAPKLFR